MRTCNEEAVCAWFSSAVRRLVFATDISKEQLDDLRAQVDSALKDPDFAIVTNFPVIWHEVGGGHPVEIQDFPLVSLRVLPDEAPEAGELGVSEPPAPPAP